VSNEYSINLASQREGRDGRERGREGEERVVERGGVWGLRKRGGERGGGREREREGERGRGRGEREGETLRERN